MTYKITPQSNTYMVKVLHSPQGMSFTPSSISYGEVLKVSELNTKRYNKGDKIIFDVSSSVFIRVNDQEICLVKEEDILAKIEKEAEPIHPQWY